METVVAAFAVAGDIPRMSTTARRNARFFFKNFFIKKTPPFTKILDCGYGIVKRQRIREFELTVFSKYGKIEITVRKRHQSHAGGCVMGQHALS
jgi:hypothetical protein